MYTALKGSNMLKVYVKIERGNWPKPFRLGLPDLIRSTYLRESSLSRNVLPVKKLPSFNVNAPQLKQ